jgi:MtaA/CmuA family methyltransferase
MLWIILIFIYYRNIVDLVSEAHALGGEIIFNDSHTPKAGVPIIRTKKDLEMIDLRKALLSERLKFQPQVIKKVKEYINIKGYDKKMLGSITGPFTVASYLMGASNANVFSLTKPDLLQELINIIEQLLTSYMKMLVSSGADAIFIAEPCASTLSPRQFDRFSGNCLKNIINDIKIPVILHICGNNNKILKNIAKTGVDALSFDEGIDINEAADIFMDDLVIMGNIPSIDVFLQKSGNDVFAYTKSILEGMDSYFYYVPSSGCALAYHTQKENLLAYEKAFMEHNYLSLDKTKILGDIKKSVLNGNADLTISLIEKGIEEKIDINKILHASLINGINQAARMYDKLEYFIPELLLSAEAFYSGLDRIKSLIAKQGDPKSKGVIVIGTVENDIHDIGKNLVAMMLESNGYKIIDLGKDVSIEEFKTAAIKHQADFLALSALTTQTMDVMEKVIKHFKNNEELAHIKVVVGGAPVN